MRDRTLKIALAASLAGNLFLAGLFVGERLLADGEGASTRHHRSDRFSSVAARLDPADAEALRELMRRKGREAEPRVEALRSARKEVQAALGRPNYDPEAVRAALARVRAEETSLRADLDRTLLAFAAGLEPEERAAIAPLLRKGGRGWRERPKEEAPR